MDPIGVLSRALDQTGDLLDHVHADVLERPTPCTEWDVSALADHVINDSHQFLLMVCGKQPDWSALAPHVTQGWGPTFRAAADDLIHAWRGLGDNPPLPPAIQFAEFAVHDWDLATALGLPLNGLDPEVAQARPRFHAGQLDPRAAGRRIRTRAAGTTGRRPLRPDRGVRRPARHSIDVDRTGCGMRMLSETVDGALGQACSRPVSVSGVTVGHEGLLESGADVAITLDPEAPPPP